MTACHVSLLAVFALAAWAAFWVRRSAVRVLRYRAEAEDAGRMAVRSDDTAKRVLPHYADAAGTHRDHAERYRAQQRQALYDASDALGPRPLRPLVSWAVRVLDRGP